MSEHILFVVNNYPPSSGGVQQHVAALATHLANLGHQCTVVALSDAPSDSFEDGVRVIRLPKRGNVGDVLSFPQFGTKRFLKRYIADHNVTAVSVHTRFFPMTWVGIAAARSTNTKSILTEHGSGYVQGVSPFVRFASGVVDVTFGRRSLRHASKRLAVSRESANFVFKLSGKLASVFPNATDVSFWYASSLPRPSRFIFLGRIVPNKGWAESIEAFSSFTSLFPDQTFDLHIIGDGPEFTSALRLASESPVAARIHVEGRQNHEQIRDLLSGQWLVNPTKLAEGFQTTLLEAAVAGAGIISYPTPGLSDLQESGTTVLIANSPADLARSFGEAATAQPAKLSKIATERWGWQVRAQQYAEIIERLRAEGHDH